MPTLPDRPVAGLALGTPEPRESTMTDPRRTPDVDPCTGLIGLADLRCDRVPGRHRDDLHPLIGMAIGMVLGVVAVFVVHDIRWNRWFRQRKQRRWDEIMGESP
jgi:hypothetical protein